MANFQKIGFYHISKKNNRGGADLCPLPRVLCNSSSPEQLRLMCGKDIEKYAISQGNLSIVTFCLKCTNKCNFFCKIKDK